MPQDAWRANVARAAVALSEQVFHDLTRLVVERLRGDSLVVVVIVISTALLCQVKLARGFGVRQNANHVSNRGRDLGVGIGLLERPVAQIS